MSAFNNIAGMSENGLKGMQRAIHDRLIEEDALPAGQQKIYGVREYQDWREQADEMEAELDLRRVNYTKVPW